MNNCQKFPRSISAYDNLLATCLDDESDVDSPPTSSEFSRETNQNRIFSNEMAVCVEVNVPKDNSHRNGMAFRLVGSRSRGIFVAYINSNSSQNLHLREGDRIVKCNNISLNAVSVDQAASVMRFWMNRNNEMNLVIERHPSIENKMIKRRRQARLSMCLDQQEQHLSYHESIAQRSRATLKITSSRSAEILRQPDPYPPSSFQNPKTPRYVSFDTAATLSNSQKNVCPQCHSPTRLIYLHQFSHGLLNNAFRLLSSRSSYSLL